ncbi:MAG TPA: chemotaxis protein CheW [Capsulimonadaceae bacterium]|jgi:purine-binding chemotaxis protein CheW
MAATIENIAVSLEHGINQYLTFSLAGEEYGVDILKVQEIKGYVPTTRLPNSPAHVAGVLNLRGTIVPLVDLRSKFNLEPLDHDKFNAIIVMVVGEKVVGVIVDSVSEVATINSSEIQEAPDFARGANASVVTGVAQVADKLIILLNMETVFADDAATFSLAA